jgi:hypothetical protein
MIYVPNKGAEDDAGGRDAAITSHNIQPRSTSSFRR